MSTKHTISLTWIIGSANTHNIVKLILNCSATCSLGAERTEAGIGLVQGSSAAQHTTHRGAGILLWKLSLHVPSRASIRAVSAFHAATRCWGDNIAGLTVVDSRLLDASPSTEVEIFHWNRTEVADKVRAGDHTILKFFIDIRVRCDLRVEAAEARSVSGTARRRAATARAAGRLG